MPGLNVRSEALVSRQKPYPPNVWDFVSQMEQSNNPLGKTMALALRNVGSSIDDIHKILRTAPPQITKIAVTDDTGKVVGFIGDFEFAGVVTRNYFSEIHIGDPLGTGDPTQAVINVNPNGEITVGSTGWVDVVDPYNASAAWIGTKFDTLDVTGAANNGSGLIRLTIASHAFLTGDSAIIQSVGGVPNATGQFTLTKIDATHVDLQNSVWDGTYTSGGTATRLLHVTGAVDNGAGLIRLTVTAHGYESGDKVSIASVGGVSAATGQWIISVITANTFDLVGSTFSGTYTSGGTCIRYFAGGLFQTIAVGPSFPGYKLRAFADGTLKIQDAQITLAGTGATIDLDPTAGTITVTETSPGVNRVTINNLGIKLDTTSGTAYATTISPSSFQIQLVDSNSYQINMLANGGASIYAPTTSLGLSKLIDLYGYTGSSVYGPVVSCTQLRGSGASPTASQSGDTLGGIICWGFDGTGESSYPVGILGVATEAHGASAHGGKITFETTPNGSTTAVVNMILNQDGTLDVVGGYKANGSAGISTTKTFGTGVTGGFESTALKGTPGVGQSQFSAMTSLTLSTDTITTVGGIVTA